jgi:hypothetical protein
MDGLLAVISSSVMRKREDRLERRVVSGCATKGAMVTRCSGCIHEIGVSHA